MTFGSSMKRLSYGDVAGSLRTMEDHIRSMQEQLEYTLCNLDSANVTSLDTSLTDIASRDGGISISGDLIKLTGAGGRQVVMGNEGGVFALRIAGAGGASAIYLDSRGRLVVGAQADVHVDCGTWDV